MTCGGPVTDPGRIGTGGVGFPDKPLGRTRREQVEGLARHLRAAQAQRWSAV